MSLLFLSPSTLSSFFILHTSSQLHFWDFILKYDETNCNCFLYWLVFAINSTNITTRGLLMTYQCFIFGHKRMLFSSSRISSR